MVYMNDHSQSLICKLQLGKNSGLRWKRFGKKIIYHPNNREMVINMNKMVLVSFLAIGIIAIAGNVLANGDGPAPNSGDGVSDGSGFDPEPNGEGVYGDGHGTPAPNSGDGVPDGPGWN
jgi:hypothetical protein